MPKQQSNIRQRTRYNTPKMYNVLIHNDDVTTMDFVVNILKTIFGKSQEDAESLMLSVHHKGQAVVGTYTYDMARTKVSRATALAREKGFPLRLTFSAE